MNFFAFKNPFSSFAFKEYDPLRKKKYFENHNILSNSAETQINSVLLKHNDKRLKKSEENNSKSSKSEGEIDESKGKKSYVESKSRRPSLSSRDRNTSTSSHECATEFDENQTPRKNSRKQKKCLQIRILSPFHQSMRSNIVVKKSPGICQNESRKLKKTRTEDNYKTLSKTQNQIFVKGKEIVEIPCGESGKWKYIRMYQERNRRREARRRRKRQKEKEEAQSSGRRRSTRKRRKSKKRSKSRSRRRSRRRKSKSRSKSRRRSRSRRSSRSRRRRGSTKRKRRQG